jgi:hypothetical protein
MGAAIVAGAVLPDCVPTDHTGNRRKLSDLQGPDSMILVLSRGGYCPKSSRRLTCQGVGRTRRRRSYV